MSETASVYPGAFSPVRRIGGFRFRFFPVCVEILSEISFASSPIATKFMKRLVYNRNINSECKKKIVSAWAEEVIL